MLSSHFLSEHEELLFYKRSYRDALEKQEEHEGVIRGLLSQFDVLRSEAVDTRYLVDENKTLKRQNADLTQELDATKRGWMVDVSKHLSVVDANKQRILGLEQSLAALVQQKETENSLRVVADVVVVFDTQRFAVLHRDLTDVAVVLRSAIPPRDPSSVLVCSPSACGASVLSPSHSPSVSTIARAPMPCVVSPEPFTPLVVPLLRVITFSGINEEVKPRLIQCIL